MDFLLTDDQTALQEELRRLLAARATPEARRKGLDRALWAELGDMGLFALVVPESEGGVGLGLAEAVISFEELGRALVPGPTVATFLAGVAGVVEGASRGAAVVGAVEAAAPAMVEHLDELDALLVLDGDDVRVVRDLPAGRLAERPLDPLTPVSVVDDLPAGEPVTVDVAGLRRTGRLLTAAFQVGLGQAAVDLGVGHARSREQFGRPIGAFQAVKHQLADAAVAVEVARAGVHAAAVGADEGDPGSEPSADAARIVASRAADRAARACIQVHGGMGFTWELDAHLLLKRSMVLDTTLGGVEDAVDRYARTI